jgi:hypothetical protein
MFFLASPQMYDPVAGDATQVVLVTALLAFLSVAAAVFSFSREVVKENQVYQRERQVNLKMLPYALAKIGVVIPIAIYQGLVWTGLFFLATQVPNGFSALPWFFITLALSALAGGLIGLIASGLGSSVPAAVSWAVVLVLPQLFLNGGIIPLGTFNPIASVISAGMPTRYAFEALVELSGYGQDLASDFCWAMPEGQRQALTDSDKQSCPCMGANIFSKCNFPGVAKFSDPVLSQAAPPKPTADSGLSTVPVQPTPAPGESVDQYFQAVKNYTLQLEIYHGSLGGFINGLDQYSNEISDWQRKNGLAVGRAEGLLSSQVDAYGPVFEGNPISNWLSLTWISLALVVLYTVVQKGKGIG